MLSSPSPPRLPQSTSRSQRVVRIARSRSPQKVAARSIYKVFTQTFIFLELFAGAGGLSKAIKEIPVGVEARLPIDGWNSDWDMLTTQGFEEALTWADQVDWLHAAPPCRTFSRRRRADQFGKVKQLRSKERPEGCGDADADQANMEIDGGELPGQDTHDKIMQGLSPELQAEFNQSFGRFRRRAADAEAAGQGAPKKLALGQLST